MRSDASEFAVTWSLTKAASHQTLLLKCSRPGGRQTRRGVALKAHADLCLRTTLQILRKRAQHNKENDGRDGKRGRMRGRRVSFAPDDELETMHLYQKARTEPRPRGSNALQKNITSGIPALSTLVEEDEEASGHGLFDSQVQSTERAAAANHGGSHEDDNWHEANPRGRLPESALQQVQPGSIGGGPLQTEAAVGSPDGRRLLAGNALEDLVVSPATPFMSLTTGGASLGGHGPGAMDDTDELKNKWGFTPGADDTLDASHGRLVMGDTTYNHVYGSSTTGDITKSMQANQNTGASNTLSYSVTSLSAGGAKPATNRSAIAAAANATYAAAAAVRSGLAAAAAPAMPAPAASGALGNLLAAIPARHQVQTQPAAEMTINLLADDTQMDPWRQAPGPACPVPCASAASSLQPRLVAANMEPQAAHSTVGPSTRLAALASAPYGQEAAAGGSTTALLGGGMAAARTATAFTMQLLADSTTTRAPFQQLMPGIPQQGQVNGATAGEVAKAEREQATAASCSLGLAMAGLAGSAGAACHDITAVSMDFSTMGSSGGIHGLVAQQAAHQLLMDEDDAALTLDDFARPPELAHTGRLDASAAHSQHLQQLASRQVQPGDQPSAIHSSQPWSLSQPTSGSQLMPLPQPASQQLVATQQQLELSSSRDGLQSSSQPVSQPSSQLLLSSKADGQVQQLGPVGFSAQDLKTQLQGSQAGEAASQAAVAEGPKRRAAPPITFQDFLGLVEVRFLDDMRRRTSLLQPFEAGGLAIAASLSSQEAHPTSLADALEQVHLVGVRGTCQQACIQELAERVEGLQAAIQAGEATLAQDNPAIFSAVQTADPEELELIRDQVKLLKRVCRHRTMLAWKQARIHQEQALAERCRDALAALEQEVPLAKRALDSALALEKEASAVHSEVVALASQEASGAKAAQVAMEREAAAAARLAEVAAANAARQAQLTEAQREQQATQARYEEALQQHATLAKRLQHLKNKTLAASSTEAASQPPATPASQRLTRCSAHLDVLMSLQGLALDVRSLDTSRTWSLVLHNRFRLTFHMSPTSLSPTPGPGTKPASPARPTLLLGQHPASVPLPDEPDVGRQEAGQQARCKVVVGVHSAGFHTSQLALTLLPYLEAMCSRTLTLRSAKLPLFLDEQLVLLSRASAAVTALEAALLQWPALTRITVTEPSQSHNSSGTVSHAAATAPSRAVSAGQAGESTAGDTGATDKAQGPEGPRARGPEGLPDGLYLTMWFATAQGCGARMSLSLEAQDLLRLPSQQPRLRVAVLLPKHRAQELTLDAQSILQGVPASHSYLHQLCASATRLVLEAAGCDVTPSNEGTVLSASAAAAYSMPGSGEPVGTLQGIPTKLRAHAEVQASLRSLKRNSEGRPCHLLLLPALAAPSAAPSKQEYIIDDNGFQLRRSQLEQLVTSPEVVLALGDARLQASLSRIDSSGERREQELEAALQGPAFASFAEKVRGSIEVTRPPPGPCAVVVGPGAVDIECLTHNGNGADFIKARLRWLVLCLTSAAGCDGNMCGSTQSAELHSTEKSKHTASVKQEAVVKAAPPPLPDFAVPKYFQVVRMLGEGGSGETWLCKDVRTGDELAIKFIARPIQKAVLPMILHEVKIQAALGEGHLSLVQARELFLAKRHLGLAMEYVSGGNLTAYVTEKWDSTGIRNGLFLTEDEARYFFKQFLGAVEFLHKNHVAHRDLKLDNIVLDSSKPPRIKLCDFGFAKNWEGQSNMFTQIGTPVYMSPQVINSKSSNQGYDAQKADVWACGVLLFVMLLGMFPFEHNEHPDPNSSDAHVEVFLQQIKCSWRENPRIADFARKLSDNCRDLLDKIFEMDEAKRIDIVAIRQHPWYLTPLPAVYENALNTLAAEQAAVKEQVAAGKHKVEARDKALQRLVNRAGETFQEGLDSEILPRVWLARGEPPYEFEVDEDDVDLDILEEEEAAAQDSANAFGDETSVMKAYIGASGTGQQGHQDEGQNDEEEAGQRHQVRRPGPYAVLPHGLAIHVTLRFRAGTGMVHGVKLETIDSASNEVKALIRQLNRLANASTLEEHTAALAGFDEDVTLDTPFIQIQGRERIRILATLSKFFLGHFELEPRLVKISVPESAATKGGVLEVDGIVHWLPHRPWYFLPSLFLPRDIPIFADVSMGIKAHNDKVFFVSGKNHNLPHVPRILRILAGYVAGATVSITEPAFNTFMDWYHAGVNSVTDAKNTSIRATEYLSNQATKATDMAQGTAASLTEKVTDTMTSTMNKVADVTSCTVSKAADMVGMGKHASDTTHTTGYVPIPHGTPIATTVQTTTTRVETHSYEMADAAKTISLSAVLSACPKIDI
ncbi:hypothetical protein QJQ45_026294 [Haematococcus lacustris]|nr:hypothetical protein QJQ45_026294 [Haematococcus lacustris]